MKNPVIVLFLFIVASLIVLSNYRPGDPIVDVPDSNKEMKAAIKMAKKTLPEFLKIWKSKPQDSVSVKVPMMTSAGGVEQIWFRPISIQNQEMTASCANYPADIPNLQIGDTRVFHLSEVTDWMILEGKHCYGGYTIRVLSELEPENAPDIVFFDLPKGKN